MQTRFNGTATSQPFGSVEASTDTVLLESFMRVPHVLRAIDPSISLLTGRRAAGKTAVAVYLREGNEVRFDVVVQFQQKDLLGRLLALDERQRHNRSRPSGVTQTSLTSDHFIDLWNLVIWRRVVESLSRSESFLASVDRDAFEIIRLEFEDTAVGIEMLLMEVVGDAYGRDIALFRILGIAEKLFESYAFREFRVLLTGYLEGHQLLIVADTIEDYRVRNELVDRALSGMLMAMASFTSHHRMPNLHVKCFFPAEIYSYLQFEAPFNIRKVEQHMVHLKWTPKQLRTMLSRRISHWLEDHHPATHAELGLGGSTDGALDARVWGEIFPSTIRNKQGVEEDTFLYIARHTQLHPGQLIWICNAIAAGAADRGHFPTSLRSSDVTQGVSELESRIASSVLAPYSPVYPNIANVLKAALNGSPNLMTYRDFTDLYKKALDVWPHAQVVADRYTFERMALDTGVVGKLKKETDLYYITHFEYDSGDELGFAPDDLCAIHPAFYDLMEINTTGARKFVCPHVVINDLAS